MAPVSYDFTHPTLKPSSHPDSLPNVNEISSVWSKEDIFTFIGILVGLFTIMVMILIASPTLRAWFRRTFDRKLPKSRATRLQHCTYSSCQV